MDDLKIGKDGMLGKLAGVFSTVGENRNDYPARESSFRHAFESPLFKEKIANGGMIGRLDHTNHSEDANPDDETLLKEAAIVVKKVPEIRDDGTIYGEAYILNTPNGRLAYVLAKSGMALGTSYRGGIDSELYAAGKEEEAWDEFEIEAFDLVYIPAYEEARLKLVEDYVDETPQAAKKRAGATIAKNIMKVAASAKQRKELLDKVSVVAQLNKDEIVDANKELSASNPSYVGKDVKEKAEKMAKTDGENLNPKHIAPMQEGNTTMYAHDEETDDKEEVITDRNIDVLNKGNEEPTLEPILPLKQMVENIHEGKKASITPSEAKRRLEDIAEETAEEMVEEKEEEIKKETKEKASLEMGMAAKGKSDTKEGELDEKGLRMKKRKKGDKEEDKGEDKGEDKEKDKEERNAGFISVAGNDDDEDIKLVNEEELDESEENGNADETLSEGEESKTPEEKLADEVAKLTDTVAELETKVTELTETLDTRNSEYDDLEARYKRLKASMAQVVDKRRGLESRCAALEKGRKEMGDMLAQTKSIHAESNKRLRGEVSDLKEVIAGLQKDRETQERSMRVTAAALKKAEQDKRVLASSKSDVLGRLAVRAIAEVYGVSAEKLLARKSAIKNQADLETVIAKLQKENRSRRVTASMLGGYEFPDFGEKSNASYAVPEEIAEVMALYEDNEE